MMRVPIRFTVLICVLALVPACHKENVAAPAVESTDPVVREAFSASAMAGGVVGHAGDPHSLTKTELLYGRAPQSAPGLTYQDGIVLMEHGDQAIRGTSSDGLTWIIDANAPHANEIQVDKVLFATERCVGKVLDVQRNGDELKVILGPAQITDVVKQGHFVYNQPIDLNNFVAVQAPDYPGAPDSDAAQKMNASKQTSRLREQPHVEYSIVSASGEWKPMTTVSYSGGAHLVQASWHPPHFGRSMPMPASLRGPKMPGGNLPLLQVGNYFPNWPKVPQGPLPMTGGIPQVNLPNMKMRPCFADCGGPSGLGLYLYTEKGGTKVELWATLYMQAPSLKFNIDVSPGYVKTAAIELSGAAGFSLVFKAGAEQAFQANLHNFGQVPLDISFPVVGLGVPLSLKLFNTFKLDTGFSAKTSVLQANADYSAGGKLSMGYINNKWGATGMKMEPKHSLAGAISGVSVGINSLVFGVNQTVMIGLGAFGFSAGPYVSLVSTITALDQSSIALTQCAQGTFNMGVYAGIGWSIPKVIADIVNFFLGLANVKPVPASGDIVRMKEQVVLTNLKEELPPGCSDAVHK
jgi:hypothetical protein